MMGRGKADRQVRELYYYTTTDTLRFILEKGDIYATNIRYMNDSEEYSNGIKELRLLINDEDLVTKWLGQKKERNLTYAALKSKFTEEALQRNMCDADFYSISFCQKNDLLSQWAIYARESGVSIKMNFDGDSYTFLTESAEKVDGKTAGKARFQWENPPQEVYYFTRGAMMECLDDYKERAFAILERLLWESGEDPLEDIDKRWRYIGTYIKRYNFYQEAESRLVFHTGESVLPPKIQYRCDKKVLKPYLDIECEGGWPIWEIMIGPGFNQEAVFNSVKHFLENVAVKNGVTSVQGYIQRADHYIRSIQDCTREKEACQEKDALREKDIPKKIEDLLSYTKYKELKDSFSGVTEAGEKKLSEARINFFNSIREICTEIHANRNEEPFTKFNGYIEAHQFTESGIVVSKSSIPYLF